MKQDYIKAIKIAVGVCIAVLLSTFFGLQNTVSAGIITILSLQDTKRETFRLARKRLVCFVAALGISFVCFKILGYNIWAFSIFVLLFVLFCQLFKMPESISVCCVLISHFLIKGSMNLGFVINETLLLIIGAGVGIILNLFLFTKESDMRKEQIELDIAFKAVLYNLADVIGKKETIDVMSKSLAHMKKELEDSRDKAFNLMENSLLEDYSYYMKYFELRDGQLSLLEQIYNHVVRLRVHTVEALEVEEFIRHFADNLHECNDGSQLLAEASVLKMNFKLSQLPTSRDEFESRAVLFSIFDDIIHILMQKKFFVSTLNEEQKETFLNNCRLSFRTSVV